MFAYAVVGIAAGILGGLLGIGGGVITVPCLYYIFYLIGYPHPYLMLLAIGTSLAAMIFNTAASTWAHNKRGSVLWDVCKRMAPGLIIGSIIGAFVAKYLPEKFLEIFFGVFLCILAINFLRKHPSHEEPHRLPRLPFLLLWSSGIGGISNILGIGGGTLIVPFLTAFKVPAKKAIGTSAACSFLITSIGALSYFIIGLNQVHLPEEMGYIDLPAFAIIGVVSFFAAPFGAKWTHELPIDRIRKIFALVLIVTGVSMMV
jgi:uncharacterized membrane protein YfcA